MKQVLVAMSGGVDSAVAALLLQQQGYEVGGATMLLRPEAEDALAARDVCRRVGIPHYTFDLRESFQAQVMDFFAQEYRAGRTPNPCIQCNKHLKFGAFFDEARRLGYDGMATGHYAQVEHAPTGSLLKKARSQKKDQSYVLYHLSPAQLAHTLLPLGAYEKEEVRALARAAGFKNSDSGESQDICFLPQGDYGAFVEGLTGPAPAGDFVDQQGRVLGTHRGLHHYTLGQRKGLGIAWSHPLYVIGKDIAQNRVILGREEDLLCHRLEAGQVNWLVPPAFPQTAAARTRYHQREGAATITPLGAGAVAVTFAEPVRAPTPGQAVVFYQGDTVLGGGTIR